MAEFTPGVKGEAKELALAMHAVLTARPLEESTAGTAALVELLAWWVREDAKACGISLQSCLLATTDLLIMRALAVPRA